VTGEPELGFCVPPGVTRSAGIAHVDILRERRGPNAS
jgi:hypothetical protein